MPRCSSCRQDVDYTMPVIRMTENGERWVLRYCTKPECSDRCAQVTGQLYAY